MRGACLLLGALLWAGPARAQETCTDQAHIFSFQAPPMAAPALREALRAGRAYLGRAQFAACGPGATGLRCGYIVAILALGKVSFTAPEPLGAALRRCLEQAAERLGPVPAAFARGPAEVRRVFLLREPERDPPRGPRGAAGRRGQAEIEAEVGRHLPALSACFEELWQERPRAAGTLVLRLTIGEHGGVEEAKVLRREPTMQAAEPCVLQIAGRFRFSPRWGAGRTLMSYPLVLIGPE